MSWSGSTSSSAPPVIIPDPFSLRTPSPARRGESSSEYSSDDEASESSGAVLDEYSSEFESDNGGRSTSQESIEILNTLERDLYLDDGPSPLSSPNSKGSTRRPSRRRSSSKSPKSPNFPSSPLRSPSFGMVSNGGGEAGAAMDQPLYPGHATGPLAPDSDDSSTTSDEEVCQRALEGAGGADANGNPAKYMIFKPVKDASKPRSPDSKERRPAKRTTRSGKTALFYKMYKTEVKLIKRTLEEQGFRRCHNSDDWHVMWCGTNMKPYNMMGLRDFQKVNHFPRSYEATRKDKMYSNIIRMQQLYGTKHFNFVPTTFVLPRDMEDFREQFHRDPSSSWIIKPTASSRGRGIQVIHSLGQLPSTTENLLVSRYIDNPLLIDGYKFDIRVYAVVTCFDPLRVYLYKEGLARFATEKYTKNVRHLSNNYVHLTNYSINKKSENFVQNEDEDEDGVGSKWSLRALKRYLRQRYNADVKTLWSGINDIVIKTLISIESFVHAGMKMFVPHRTNCFEIFGFDIMVDDAMRPWLLEVNLSPSLACDSPLDAKIKSRLIADTFTLVGFSTMSAGKREQLRQKRLLEKKKSPPSKSKFSPKAVWASPTSTVTSDVRKPTDLTPEEKKVLRDAREEYLRRGRSERIFPTGFTRYYDQFFDEPRPLNKLLAENLFPNRPASASDPFRQGRERGKRYSSSTSSIPGTKDSVYYWPVFNQTPGRQQSQSTRPRTVSSIRRATTARPKSRTSTDPSLQDPLWRPRSVATTSARYSSSLSGTNKHAGGGGGSGGGARPRTSGQSGTGGGFGRQESEPSVSQRERNVSLTESGGEESIVDVGCALDLNYSSSSDSQAEKRAFAADCRQKAAKGKKLKEAKRSNTLIKKGRQYPSGLESPLGTDILDLGSPGSWRATVVNSDAGAPRNPPRRYRTSQYTARSALNTKSSRVLIRSVSPQKAEIVSKVVEETRAEHLSPEIHALIQREERKRSRR